MDITRSVLYIYPNLDPTVDFAVTAGANGPYISEWNTALTQPTQAELDVAWFQVSRKDKRGLIANTGIQKMREEFDEVDTSSDDPIWLALILLASNSSDARLSNIQIYKNKMFEGFNRVSGVADMDFISLESITWDNL